MSEPMADVFVDRLPKEPLTPAQAMARLLDRRERQVAAMLAGMSSSEHPDEWRDMDRGAGRLNATLLTETQALIAALLAVHPQADEKLIDAVEAMCADVSAAQEGGLHAPAEHVLRVRIWRLLARRP